MPIFGDIQSRGDLIVTVYIELPNEFNSEQKKLISELFPTDYSEYE